MADVAAGRIPPGERGVACINGMLYDQEVWHELVLRENDVVQIRFRADGGEGSNPVGVILSIGLLVAAPHLAPALGLTGLGAGLFTAGVSTLGLLAINALFPPRPPRRRDTERSRQYSLSGGANALRPREPMLLLLGHHRVFPDYASQFYTEYDENGDQILNQIFDFGLGDLDRENDRIGETLLTAFDSAQTAQNNIGNRFVETGEVDLAGGTFAPNTYLAGERTPANTVRIQFNLRVLNHRDRGGPGVRTTEPMSFSLEYRRVGETDWTANPETVVPGVTWANRTFTYRVQPGTYEIRARATDGLIAFQPGPGAGNPANHNSQAMYAVVAHQTAVVQQGGSPQQPQRQLVAGNVDTIMGGDLEYNVPLQRTTARDTYLIAFDVNVQHFRAGDRGVLDGRDTVIRFEHRGEGTSTWHGFTRTLRTPDGAEARNMVRRSFSQNIEPANVVPSGRYEIRATLLTEVAMDDDGNLTDDRLTFEAKIVAFRAHQPMNADFAGQNPLAVRIKATGQLYNRIERFNADCWQLIPAWNATSQTWIARQRTSNPGALLRKWFQGFYDEDGELIAGFGLEDDEIDHEALQGFYEFCDANGLECNVVLQDDRDEDQIATLIAQCGWGRVDTSSGKHSVIWEDAGRPLSTIVNPTNIIRGTLNINYDNQDLADQIVGQFIDRDSDFMENELRRDVPNLPITGEFPATVQLEGITDGTHAAKEINRTAAAQFYHRRIITWEMLEEGFLGIGVGDVVGMANGLLGDGDGPRILSIDSTRRILTTVFLPFITSGVARVGLPWGDLHTTTYTLDDGDVVLADALPDPVADVEEDDPHAYRITMYPSGAVYTAVRITGFEPVSAGRYRFTARDEVQAYYDARVANLDHPLIPLRSTDVSAVEGFSISETLEGIRVFNWQPHQRADTIGYELRYGDAGATWFDMVPLEGLVTTNRLELLDLPPQGEHRCAIVARFNDGQRSDVTYLTHTFEQLGIRGEDGLAGYSHVVELTDFQTSAAAVDADEEWFFTGGTGDEWPNSIETLVLMETTPGIIEQFRLVRAGTLITLYKDARNWGNYRIMAAPTVTDAGLVTFASINLRDSRGIPSFSEGDSVFLHFNPKGVDGEDGAGNEWIFARTASPSIPSTPGSSQLPLNNWGFDDFPQTVNGLTWTDGGVGVTEALPYEWRAWRRVDGSPNTGDSVPYMWGMPAIIGRWADDGQPGLDGVAGADGVDGVDGNEYIFHRSRSASIDNPLNNNWGYDQPGTGWDDGAPTLSDTYPYLWRAQRRVPARTDGRRTEVGDSVTDLWSMPSIIGRYGVQGDPGQPGLDGVAGADGVDGVDGNEYIFHRSRSASIDNPLNNNWGYDQPGTGWDDGAPTLSATYPILWRSQRRVPARTSGRRTRTGDSVSDLWSQPVIVGRYGVDGEQGPPAVDGADGRDGEPGEDGQGYEYIFRRTATPSVGTSPSNSARFDRPPSGWTDGAPSLTASLPYLWRAYRKVPGDTNVGDSVTDLWTNIVIVGRYAVDGEQGPPAVDGADGADGQGWEYIFRRTTSPSVGTFPSNSATFDRPPSGWDDGAPSLTSSFQYLWRSFRRVPGDTSTGDSVTDLWSNPAIVGRYAVDGEQGPPAVDGADGRDGDPGEDGQGYEYIFRRTASASVGVFPSNSARFDRPPSGWDDGAPSLTTSLPYLWRAYRKVPGDTNPGDSVTDLWTNIVIVGRYGPDGLQGIRGNDGAPGRAGIDGDDGDGIEWIYRVTSTSSRPAMPSNFFGYERPTSPWDDAAPNLTATNKWLWVSQRRITGSPSPGASISGLWSTPRLVGRYGEDGDDAALGEKSVQTTHLALSATADLTVASGSGGAISGGSRQLGSVRLTGGEGYKITIIAFATARRGGTSTDAHNVTLWIQGTGIFAAGEAITFYGAGAYVCYAGYSGTFTRTSSTTITLTARSSQVVSINGWRMLVFLAKR